MNFLFLDIIFKLIDKNISKPLTQCKEDLIQFSIDFIDTYEDNKETQHTFLKDLMKDMKDINFHEKVISLYTKECFLYRMINNTLRRQGLIEIFKIRYIIYFLRQKIALNIRNERVKTLFRGTKIPIIEFEKMKNHIGIPFLLNGFISTSEKESVALKFALHQKMEDNFFRILFEIEANDNDIDKFTSIEKDSKFPWEKECLINVNTFLSIIKIEQKELQGDVYYHVHI